MRNFGLFSLLSLIAVGANAQHSTPANVLLAAGSQAVHLWGQVPINDTNNTRALYELSLKYARESNFTAALQTCEEALQMDDKSFEMELLTAKAGILENAGNTAHALAVYDSALARYPNATALLFNAGTCFLQHGRAAQAEGLFQNLVFANPYQVEAHWYLANCALQTGRIVPAMMAAFTYLLLNPQATHAKEAVSLLENISLVNGEVPALLEKRKTAEFTFGHPERVILSKMALEKKFKLAAATDLPQTRQLQALLDELTYDEISDDFYMQYYVPFLRLIYRYNYFEPSVNQALSSLPNESVKTYLKKKKEDLTALQTEINLFFSKIRQTGELSFQKRQSTPSLNRFDPNGALVSHGRLNEFSRPVGPWVTFYPNGNIKDSGSYNNSGQKDGYWKYYLVTSEPERLEKWEAGIQTGEELSYYPNGMVRSKTVFLAGKREGEKRTFYPTGALQLVEAYKGNRREGPFTAFYANGAKQQEGRYANDSLTGLVTTYFPNAQVASKTVYAKGLPEGAAQTYYPGGRLESDRVYHQGRFTGKARIFHPNGKIKEERTYVDGREEGTVLLYDEDGKLYCTQIFEKGMLKKASFQDRQGKETGISERQNEELVLTSYNSEGIKTAQTRLDAFNRPVGSTTQYYPSGKTKETATYQNGMQEGVTKGFYENGATSYEITFSNGRKNGPAAWYYFNGQLKKKGFYRNDQETGIWEVFNEKGIRTERYGYSEGQPNGPHQYFRPDGSPDYEEIYNLGLLTGLNLYDAAGKIISSASFTNGNGRYTGTYANGKKRFDGLYTNGVRQGLFSTYYPDGSVYQIISYERGLRDGSYSENFPGGDPAVRGFYKLGEKTGKWKYFQADGSVGKEENYVNNQLQGKTFLYRKGKLEEEITYQNGLADDTLKHFAPDGQLCYALFYRNGNLLGYSYKDKTGALLPMIPLPGGTGQVQASYAGGSRSAELEFADGKKNGFCRLFYPNGKPMYEATFAYGYENGKVSEYDANGNVRSESQYVYGHTEGPVKE